MPIKLLLWCLKKKNTQTYWFGEMKIMLSILFGIIMAYETHSNLVTSANHCNKLYLPH